MNMEELSVRIDALGAEVEGLHNHFRAVGKELDELWREVYRNLENTNIDLYELRQRIRALEVGR